MSSSRRRNAVVAWLVAITLATAPATVGAQTDAQKEQAKTLFAEGLELRDGGDDTGALEKFKQAYALVRSPITTLEYGRSLLRVGLLVEARTRLQEAASLPEKSNESAQAKDARKEAAKLAEDVGKRIPTVSIRLKGFDDADVSIDGRRVPRDEPIPVDPGTHRVGAKQANGKERHVDVTVKTGDAREVILSLVEGSGEGSEDTGRASRGEYSNTLMYAGFGLAGAGLITGLVSLKARADKLASCNETLTYGDACPGTGTLRTVAVASFLVFLVGTGLGIYGVVDANKSSSPSTASRSPSLPRLSPWIGWNAAGIEGAF